MFKKIGFVVTTLFAFASSAQAVLIQDYLGFDELTGYVGHEETLTFTHTVSDNGVGGAGATFWADSGNLVIMVMDDSDAEDATQGEEVKFEFADFSGPATQTLSYAGTLSLAAITELNDTGDLIVSIVSVFGDFNVMNSLLSIQANEVDGSVSVPEPGVLMLLGLGLVGLRVARPKTA